MLNATVISDASYDHQHKRRPAGWAAWVRIDGYPHPVKGYGVVKAACRNSTEAEVYAALNGIWLAVGRGAVNVLVRSDCMAVHHLIEGRAKEGPLLNIWHDALATGWGQSLQSIASRHVKGHANPNRHAAGWVNNWCDEHAKIAMRHARKGKQPYVRIE